MLLGTRVRIIASAAHRLVVERSYTYKALIYASLQIVSFNREFFAIHPICYEAFFSLKELVLSRLIF